jgi:hypothetical protein
MAHGFLSYQDTRGEVDWLGKVINRVNDYLENREKKEKVADMVAAKVNILNDQKTLPPGETPLLRGSDNPSLPGSPLQKMLSGSVLQRSLPGGAMAVNPGVVGGAATPGVSPRKRLTAEGFVGDKIVDIGATNLGVERDLGGDDMFVKRLEGVGGGSGEVVQAIDRLTFVTMSLVAATKEQTNQQKMIAAAQQQQAEKLARDAKSAAEESALEGGADLSGNLAYERLALAGGAAMGGGGRGGGPGMGIGGKVLAKNIMKSATKRGAARTGTRLGAALGGKMMGGLGARMGAKLGAKSVGKVAGGAIAKSLGKKIPLVGLGLGAIFAAQRAMQGDFVGAGLELASGAASTVPGIGTAGSVGIDAALAARDMTMMADGGIVDSATNAIIGEDGKEGVFPLEGSRGKKTFMMFGEGILEAQKRKKGDYAKLQALGLSEYYEKQNGWENWWTGFKDFLSKLPVIGHLFRDDEDPSDNNRNNGDLGSGLRRSLLGTFGGYDKLDPTAAGSGLGTYGTGLKTGPSSKIGGSSAYHIDSQFKSSLSMEEKVKMMDDLAAAYAARGRKIEFSNNAVAGQVWNSESSMEEKMALLQKAFEAHQIPRGREVDAGGFNRIDYYIPKIDENRFGASAEGAEILVPTRGATAMDYAQGGDYGAFVNLKDKDGNVIFRTGHGDIRGARSGSVDLSKAKSASPAASPSTPPPESPPAGAQSSQDIKQNFGLKAHDKFMFQHDGGMYEAYKTENGFDIYKHAGNLIPQKLDTSGGKNAGVVQSLIEAGTKRTSDADKLSSASADTATTVAAKSSEDAVASATPAAPQVTVVQSQGSSSGSGSGNQAAAVPAGISSSDTGTGLFQATKILNS